MSRARAALLAVASTAVVLACLWLTVRCNRDGKWSALYCHGSARALPPALAAERPYLFDGSGCDGQFYHLIAHDPFFERGFAGHVDDPRLRYRRGLLPVAAHALALGRDRWIDVTYPALVLLSSALGVFWLARMAETAGRSAAWGLAFVVLPAAITSFDRMTPDIALAALTAGFLRALQVRDERLLWASLVLAPLVRETGLLLVAATVAVRARRDGLPRGARYALALLPWAGWVAFVHAQAPGLPYERSALPLSAIAAALVQPRPYAGLPGAAAHRAADLLALAGMAWAFALVLLRWRQWREEGQAAGLLFVIMGLALQRRDHWTHVYDFGRVYSPVLLVLLRDALLRRRQPVAGAGPWGLTLTRVATQLASQVVGVLKALA